MNIIIAFTLFVGFSWVMAMALSVVAVAKNNTKREQQQQPQKKYKAAKNTSTSKGKKGGSVHPPQPSNKKVEDTVTSPTFDGVTVKELEDSMTPDDADIISAEGIEDLIEKALDQDLVRQELNQAS